MTQLPPHSHSRPVPPHTKRLRPKTYSLAVWLVYAVVLLQVVALISVFWLRAMIVTVKVSVPKGPPGTVSAQATPPRVVLPDLPDLPGLANSVPNGPRLRVPTASDKLEKVGELNDEATAFQHLHALVSAVETLLKAEDIDPRNPTTLRNLAETYKMLNDPVHARIYWQRLVDLGPAVGTVYAVAKDDVLLLGGDAGDPLRNPSDLPRQIYISQVEKTPVETLDAEAQFHVRATLRRQNPKMPLFDQKKLQPYVIFYQQMPDGSLVPDLDQHKGCFEDTFLFWSGKLSETFGVDYLMPVPGALNSKKVPEGDYYGFVIGIYYDKILQDARSEPANLLRRIPLPDEIE